MNGEIGEQEVLARIRLLRSPNLGPVSYFQLLRRFGTAIAALEALPDLVSRNGKPYRVAPSGQAEAERAAVGKAGARYIFHDAREYPRLLGELENAPPVLIGRGNAGLASRPCVAMVGARNASAGSVKLAREFARSLCEAGFVVVSGLARGIDGAAHRGALAAGQSVGDTIGVIASGIDVAYPPEHRELQETVARQGLLITERPPGSEPLARHFPARNRIIAGLAAGTVVVEAAPRSGSLITARLAGEAGREVMAVPGSPLDPRSHGCNQLIREGAVLVQSPQDVIELVTGFDGLPHSRFREGPASLFDFAEEEGRPEPLPAGPADIRRLLTTAPVSVTELIRQSGESASAVQLALVELELGGELVRHAGGRVSLAAT